MTRIALLTEIPAPYRIPLFSALAERLELMVLFLRRFNPNRPYRLHAEEFRFEWRVLPGLDTTLAGRWVILSRGTVRALAAARPEVILLGGWNQPAFWVALGWASMQRVPAVLWVESTVRERRSGRLEPVKRALLRKAAGFVVPGSASRNYLLGLGVPPERIAIAPNAVDPAIFGAAPARTRPNERPLVLGVGRLAPEKGFDLLLQAVSELPVDVVLAGTGPEESRLCALAGANVRFLGHLDRDELPALYAQADIFVMPSRSDPWGMSLNEAALAGLPLVSTDAAGAAHELIADGVNGFRVPANDVGALREALSRLTEDPALRAMMGTRSRELAACFTPCAWAEAVADVASRLRRR